MNLVRGSITTRLSRIDPIQRVCLRYNQNAASLSEYTDVPEYPPILDMSPEAKRRRRKAAWHDKITELPTVEQKLIELNMPKYYGYWSFHMLDNNPTLAGTEYAQYATRTHIVNSLPVDYYSDVKAEAERIALLVKDQVEQLIDLNFNCQLNR